jgi:hypothetical protein
VAPREPAASTTARGIAAQAFVPVAVPVAAPAVAAPVVAAPAVVAAPVVAVPATVGAPVVGGEGEDEPTLVVVAAPRDDAPAEVDDDGDVAPTASVAGPSSSAGAPVVVEDEDDDADPLAGLPLNGVDVRWRAFVASLQRQRAGVFRMARVKAIGDDVIDVAFSHGWGVDEVTRLATDPAIVGCLERAFGRNMRLTVAREESGGVSIQEAEEALQRELQQKLEAHARAHPLVQKAVALFGGEVRAVRRA